LFNPYLFVSRASDRVPLGSRECKRKHEGCTNCKVAVDVEGERSSGHAIDSSYTLPPSLGSSIPRPRVYSNCTDTSDLCAPHYQPLENHRLRRGPHVVSAHYPASIFRNFSPTRAFSPPKVARNPARHVKRFLLCSSLFAEHSHEIRSRT